MIQNFFAQVLKKHGAVPFVRTNVPMMYMSLMTHNNIFGNTVNPFNSSRTSGMDNRAVSKLPSRPSVFGDKTFCTHLITKLKHKVSLFCCSY